MNMWAAAGLTPTLRQRRVTITAAMMYDAVTGTASPRSHTATAEYSDRQEQRPARKTHD